MTTWGVGGGVCLDCEFRWRGVGGVCSVSGGSRGRIGAEGGGQGRNGAGWTNRPFALIRPGLSQTLHQRGEQW